MWQTICHKASRVSCVLSVTMQEVIKAYRRNTGKEKWHDSGMDLRGNTMQPWLWSIKPFLHTALDYIPQISQSSKRFPHVSVLQPERQVSPGCVPVCPISRTRALQDELFFFQTQWKAIRGSGQFLRTKQERVWIILAIQSQALWGNILFFGSCYSPSEWEFFSLKLFCSTAFVPQSFTLKQIRGFDWKLKLSYSAVSNRCYTDYYGMDYC